MNPRRTVSTKYHPPGGPVTPESTGGSQPEQPARRQLPAPAEKAPEGKAEQIPVRLYPRQISRLDALRQTLAPGMHLTRTEAIRFLIDNWTI